MIITTLFKLTRVFICHTINIVNEENDYDPHQ